MPCPPGAQQRCPPYAMWRLLCARRANKSSRTRFSRSVPEQWLFLKESKPDHSSSWGIKQIPFPKIQRLLGGGGKCASALVFLRDNPKEARAREAAHLVSTESSRDWGDRTKIICTGLFTLPFPECTLHSQLQDTSHSLFCGSSPKIQILLQTHFKWDPGIYATALFYPNRPCISTALEFAWLLFAIRLDYWRLWRFGDLKKNLIYCRNSSWSKIILPDFSCFTGILKNILIYYDLEA